MNSRILYYENFEGSDSQFIFYIYYAIKII